MTLKPARDLFALLCLIGLGFAWWFFAPPALGGKTSYAVIYGISMEPKFHRGDLVLIRQESSYHVGEIVGYHSKSLHRSVLHRIVGYRNGHYIFKGDNNDFQDPEHPTADQLFGREWIHVPGVGAWLEKARTPRNAALIGAVTAFVLLLGGGASTRRRRRRRRPPAAVPVHTAANGAPPRLPAHAPANLAAPNGVHAHRVEPPRAAPPVHASALPPAPRNRAWLGYLGLGGVAIGLAAMAGAAVVAIVAYSRPLARIVTQSNLYALKGHFDYSAVAPVGAVYDHSQLKGGDPLFLNLVHDVDFTFQENFVSAKTAQLSCNASFDAFVSDGNGWRRRLSLVPQSQCNASDATLNGHVNLDDLVALTKRFERTTGSHALQYTFQLAPKVHVQGSVDDQPVTEDFDPTLDFKLESDRLVLPSDVAGGTNLDRVRTGNGKTRAEQSMGPMKVSEVRHAAIFAVPISLLVALIGGLLFMVVRGNDEVASIRRRYGPWMIDVAPAARSPHLERRVEGMEALARIAERYERLILHEQRGTMHSYLVEDDGVVYRYDAHEKATWRGDRGHAAPAEAEYGRQESAATAPRGDGPQ